MILAQLQSICYGLCFLVLLVIGTLFRSVRGRHGGGAAAGGRGRLWRRLRTRRSAPALLWESRLPALPYWMPSHTMLWRLWARARIASSRRKPGAPSAWRGETARGRPPPCAAAHGRSRPAVLPIPLPRARCARVHVRPPPPRRGGRQAH